LQINVYEIPNTTKKNAPAIAKYCSNKLLVEAVNAGTNDVNDTSSIDGESDKLKHL